MVDIDLEPGSDTGALNDDGLTNADTLHFRVEFSEPLAGLGVEDFWAGGGEVTAVEELSGESGTVYRVTVDAEDGAGSVSLQAETMGIYDVAGNQISMTGASATVTIDDSIDRSLSSKARIETADEFTNADTLAWVVSFDEDMDPSTINPEDFQVQTTEAVGYTVLASTITVTQAPAFEGDSKTYRVEATGGDLTDFNGTVQLGLVGALPRSLTWRATPTTAPRTATPTVTWRPTRPTRSTTVPRCRPCRSRPTRALRVTVSLLLVGCRLPVPSRDPRSSTQRIHRPAGTQTRPVSWPRARIRSTYARLIWSATYLTPPLLRLL